MSKPLYTKLQIELAAAGLYITTVDGQWGPASRAAFLKARQNVANGAKYGPQLTLTASQLAWSGKVSKAFTDKVVEYAKLLRLPMPIGADWLMSVMAFETGETFSPSIRNGAGAPYYGLIQFGKAAATDVGTTVEALVKLTAEQQLEYVYKFFKPYTGKLQTLSDVYMRVLWPAAVGKPESFVLFSEGSTAYLQNRGLDVNRDGKITKEECALKVSEKLSKGIDPVNLRLVTPPN